MTAVMIASVSSARGNSSGSMASSGKTEKPSSNKQKNDDSVLEKATVILEGDIDGQGTFVFQNNQISYLHSMFDYPRNVTINGEPWEDLNEPFELGFVPDYSSTTVLKKIGRNIIEMTPSRDKVELYIYDSDSSFARYQVSLLFCLLKKQTRQKEAETRNKDFLISLPEGSGKESKNKTLSATTVQPNVSPQPNEMLLGIVYDLKRTKDLKSQMIDDKDMMAIIKKFVNGSWQPKNDKSGAVRYSDLENYYCLPTRLGNTFFYMEETNWSAAPKLLRSESLMNAGGWIAVYSGYVVAPFTGKFRFVGFGDDFLCVRFNKQIVLDYGWSSATMGMTFDSWSNFQKVLAGEPETDEQSRMIKNSPFFSKYRLETLPANYSNKGKRGLQRGPVLSVQKGQVIPIEVLFADVGNGEFSTMLFIEQLDSAGRPKVDLPKKLPLFRTTKHLPAHPKLQGFPDFEDGGPIWKVVDFRGKPIPANQFARQTIKMGLRTDDDDVLLPQDKPTSETKKTDSESSTSSKKKQTSVSSIESQRNPNIQKTVSKTTRGNTTTETITEYKGDTTIETVTTTEVNGDTTVQTVTTTETKNGKVVKKTSSTTTTTTEGQSRSQTSNQNETEKAAGNSTETNTTSKKNNPTHNPFGYTRPLMEDD